MLGAPVGQATARTRAVTISGERPHPAPVYSARREGKGAKALEGHSTVGAPAKKIENR